jgi:hypothetical protein
VVFKYPIYTANRHKVSACQPIGLFAYFSRKDANEKWINRTGKLVKHVWSDSFAAMSFLCERKTKPLFGKRRKRKLGGKNLTFETRATFKMEMQMMMMNFLKNSGYFL